MGSFTSGTTSEPSWTSPRSSIRGRVTSSSRCGGYSRLMLSSTCRSRNWPWLGTLKYRCQTRKHNAKVTSRRYRVKGLRRYAGDGARCHCGNFDGDLYIAGEGRERKKAIHRRTEHTLCQSRTRLTVVNLQKLEIKGRQKKSRKF